ncbi:alpha/beta fold hydrolase [Methanosarcina sp. 1.H.A.2.2]|uniref:alpha/beta fold hydrolase n=1 Tax=Methanosarcina sp. 1.H.A.2.2 TaxID=1483601 RepID=UPI0006221680|nr:alpha/beta hydrolase [Methanosarcina sp. 1.H.A.2.2]KKH45571.1 hydrolase [Methanosarcina sp. 1.H.A.2.2]
MKEIKKRSRNISLIILAFLICSTFMLIALTYPNYHETMKEAQKQLLANSTILKTEYGDIEYTVEGEGAPVLLIHGAGGGYDQGLWLGKVFFGDDYKFISVSRYGYLRSSIPDNASIESQAAAYKVLLDNLSIDKITVVGASAGGPSATQFANDYPDRCSALILISAVSMGPAPGDQDPFYVGIIHTIQQSDYAYWLVTRFFQSTILDLMGIPTQVYEAFNPEQKELAQEMLDIMHPMSQRYKGTINDEKMIEFYTVPAGNLRAPTLIIHAKDDALVSYKHAENAHSKINQSQLVLYDTGGHGMLSQMNRTRVLMKEFLNESTY